MLQIFRITSLLEGLSFLSILAITFGLISRDFVFPVGMTHGVLFVLYLIFSLVISNQKKWSLRVWLPLFLAGFVPFAFIAVELFLTRVEKQESAVS